MEQHAYAHTAGEHHISGSFGQRFIKHLILEIKSVATFFSFFPVTFAVINALFYGAMEFLFSFDLTKEIAKIVLPPILVYCILEYMTVVPTIFALVAAVLTGILPFRYIGMLLPIAIIYSFFSILLV